jgi:hypothetical protein
VTSVLRLPLGEPVRLRHHADLIPVLADDVLISASIGPYGEAVALWSTPKGQAALAPSTPSWAAFPDAVRAHPVAARVTVHWPDPTAVTSIAELDLAQPTVQSLPDGRVLLVAARCWWRAGGPDRNARMFDAEGNPVAEATFGDGISHVLATPHGEVWVGYFDEGVFGNYGWANPGPEPVGSMGIVRFGRDLTPVWRFPDTTPGGPIADCYALNVAGESAWASYYTDFPVVRVSSDLVRVWRNSVGAAQAMIVGGGQCALIGGYGTRRDRIVVGALWDEHVPQYESVLVLPDGAGLPVEAHLVGRGHALNVFVGTRWFKVDTELLRPAAMP